MSIPIKPSKSQEIDALSCLQKTKYSTQDIKSPPIVFKNPIKKSIHENHLVHSQPYRQQLPLYSNILYSSFLPPSKNRDPKTRLFVLNTRHIMRECTI